MSNHQEVIDLARTLTRNDNLYSVQPFIKIAGDPGIGLFLERVVYWSDRSGNERFRQLRIFYKSAEEWEDEIGFSYAQVTRARKKLEAMGFIQTSKHKVNDAPTLHYYANMGAIKEAVTKYYEDKISGYTNLEKTEIQESLISEKSNPEIKQSPKSIEIKQSPKSSYNSSNSNNNSKRRRPNHSPAYQVYVEKTEYYGITKEWIEKMTATVGDKPEDLTKWGEIISTFTGRGKWKGNVEDMLKWFVSGAPVYSQNPNGNPPANKSSPKPLAPEKETVYQDLMREQKGL